MTGLLSLADVQRLLGLSPEGKDLGASRVPRISEEVLGRTWRLPVDTHVRSTFANSVMPQPCPSCEMNTTSPICAFCAQDLSDAGLPLPEWAGMFDAACEDEG